MHVVATASGQQVLEYECGVTKSDLAATVTAIHEVDNIGASILVVRLKLMRWLCCRAR